MNKIACLFALLVCMFPCIVFAGTIKGKITDKHGPLPYATIYVDGTTMGVNANSDGDYQLTLTPGTYKVVCQYIGYEQSVFNVTVNGDETITHNFMLKDQGMEMKEVVIHASSEDPAYAIIRNAIKRRKFHLNQVKAFQTDIYLKGVIRTRDVPKKIMGQEVKPTDLGVDTNGKGVLYLVEEDATYFSRNNKDRTLIHSVHESGNQNGLGFSRFPTVITFYENNIDLMGPGSRGFISPISENALSYYKYKLLGEFKENDKTIYKIRVTQKRSYEPCFEGTIYIADEDWAIHSLNMTLSKKAGMDVLDTIRIDQIFVPEQKDTWVIKSQVIYLTFSLFGFEGTGNLVTVYNNQKVNQPIPDSIFDNKIISAYDKDANKKDTSYFATRPIPLQQDEVVDYKVKDSVAKKMNNPERIDSMRIRANRSAAGGILISGASWSTKGYKSTTSINSALLEMFNFNAVEGVAIAPKVTWRHRIDTGKTLNAAVAARYGFSNTHFNAIGKLSYTYLDRTWLGRSWTVGGQAGKYVFQYNPDDPIYTSYNTYAALLYHSNDLKIYERWDGTAFLKRNYGNGLRWDVKLSYQQRLPLMNTTNYSFDKTGTYPNNLPPELGNRFVWEKNDAALVHAGIAYKPGYTYTQLPNVKVANESNLPLFSLTYDKGIPNILNSKADFDKWRFSISHDLRLRLLGLLSYNIAVGGFLNTNYVSLPDLMHLYGNRGIGLAAPYLTSFQFAQYYEFSNDDRFYVEGHVEYNLNGFLSNKIPILRQARWYLVMGNNTFYGNNNDYYTEAFVGIDNIGYKIFRFLRVDFVQSWDSHGGRNSGIRIGLKPNGLVSVKLNHEAGEEW